MPFVNGFGPIELIVILIIALIVVGPGKLPDVGSALGKSIREFRKAATDVKDSASLDATPTPSTPTVQPPAAESPAPVLPPPAPAAPPVVPAAGAAAPAPSAPAEDAPKAAAAPESGVDAAPQAARTEWPAEVTPADEQPAAPA